MKVLWFRHSAYWTLNISPKKSTRVVYSSSQPAFHLSVKSPYNCAHKCFLFWQNNNLHLLTKMVNSWYTHDINHTNRLQRGPNWFRKEKDMNHTANLRRGGKLSQISGGISVPKISALPFNKRRRRGEFSPTSIRSSHSLSNFTCLDDVILCNTWNCNKQ